MITGKKFFIIADVESVADAMNGDRTKRVKSAKKIIDTVEIVGVQTAQLGQVQGFNLAYSVEIFRVSYAGEKYLYFDGNLYEIKSMGKARFSNKMLLNVQKLDDAEIKAAVEEWMNEHL
nr:MAG TPA: hypothetical protein [Caudoviricetes sp.]